MEHIKRFARPGMDALPLYAPDTADCAIDLSDNTNLWGTPPAALRAIRDASVSAVSRYPSLYSEPLRAALLRYTGLADAVGVSAVTGCGSDDVLDSTMRAFGAPGDVVAFCAPTFSMIPVLARLNGLVPVPVPFAARFDIDAEQLLASGAKITYLCAPNNPTATSISREAVLHVIEHARGIVVIDEAYAEFAPEVFVDLVPGHEHVMVARTFSKAFGMAGLRVGFAVGADATVRLVERARGPYKVSALAERAVLAALEDTDDGLRWVRTHAELAITNRVRFAGALRALGLEPLESAANFLMVPHARARELQRSLAGRGILVRAFTGMRRDESSLEASGGSALRIGIGPWETMAAVVDALREVGP